MLGKIIYILLYEFFFFKINIKKYFDTHHSLCIACTEYFVMRNKVNGLYLKLCCYSIISFPQTNESVQKKTFKMIFMYYSDDNSAM